MTQKRIIVQENQVTAHNYAPLPVVLTKGEGVYVWDTDGKRYIDMMSAYSAVSFGHANPRLVATLTAQAHRLALVSRAFHTDKMAPFLTKLCSLSGLDMALPMNTGAEAVETAIKAARQWGYIKKSIPHDLAHIIVAKHNFHGRTTTIISFSSEPTYKQNFGPLTPGFTEIPFGDATALKKAITPHTCAFLVEPIQGEAGIIVPPKGWLKEVQTICREHHMLLLVDEVQTGLGRTGKLFAFMHEIDAPDGVIVGKALGGGLIPVSALIGTRDLMSCFTPGSHGSTFGGNPLACAVGFEALNLLIEEKLAERATKFGDYVMKRLKKMPHSFIKEIRGKGLLIGIDIDPKLASARALCLLLLEHGLLTKDTHGTVIRLAPPLIIEQSILDHALDIIEHVFSHYRQEAHS